MKVIYNEAQQNLPVFLWLEDIEDGAMAQVINLSNLPFAFHHVAIMPDSHQGYGMPIGGVLATQGVVIPNAVGVDIGCGMCAVKTSLKVEDINIEILKKIMGRIREVVPVGFAHHKIQQEEQYMPVTGFNGKEMIVKSKEYLGLKIIEQEYESALKQLGTLGGGNHFIEIQKDKEDYIWIMIHSGSRNLGYKVAKYYNDIAIELNKRWHSAIPKEWELAFLPIESQEAKDYFHEMQYCVDFALSNRKLMMNRILEAFKCCLLTYFGTEPIINIAHNYAIWENHYGRDVIIHRKGATLAREGTIGIIPGSQGSKSYIVRGRGKEESFKSCSHGAGRKMGRNEATKKLSLEEEIKKLDEQGIIHGIRAVKDLDEAAGAYKSIDTVMKNQSDLVEILVELSPLAVIKG